MVTLAPFFPGGLDAIRRLTSAGVVAANGHTNATYDDARAALDAGATVGTHLFNAMRAVHHPSRPGRCPARKPRRLHRVDRRRGPPASGGLRLAANVKPDRSVLITDAMGAAGAEDGDYTLGTRSVEVRDGVARLAGTNVIAGSTLTMATAVKYAVRVAGLPIEEVIHAATASPASMLGLDRVGELRLASAPISSSSTKAWTSFGFCTAGPGRLTELPRAAPTTSRASACT